MNCFNDLERDNLENCIKNLNNNFKFENDKFIFSDNEQTCILISKKSNYYNEIYELNNDIKENLFNFCGENNINHETIFLLEKKENCCNCISIILYIIYNNEDYVEKLEKLYFMYLLTMKKTLDIVNDNLPNFIVRYYIDKSVFNIINHDTTNEMSIKCRKILKYLFEHEKAEIYMYICNNTNYTKLRTLRFLPLIDDDTNICIVREADGIVSILDCHNIKTFEKDNKIGLFYEFYKNFLYKYKDNNSHYGEWINIYNDFKYLKTLEITTDEINKYIIIEYFYFYKYGDYLSFHKNKNKINYYNYNFVKENINTYIKIKQILKNKLEYPYISRYFWIKN
jgi:hypothetical protein